MVDHNNEEFDLGQVIGEMRGDVKLILDRTKDLSEIKEMVRSHERFISSTKRVGVWAGTPALVAFLAFVRAKWTLIFGHPIK